MSEGFYTYSKRFKVKFAVVFNKHSKSLQLATVYHQTAHTTKKPLDGRLTSVFTTQLMMIVARSLSAAALSSVCA